jgi:hypothetical protein
MTDQIEQEAEETNVRGNPIKLIDLLALYLLRDEVILTSETDSEIFNALRCGFCKQQHLIDSNTIFECRRCGCDTFEKIEV